MSPSRWLRVLRALDKAGHLAQQPPTWAGWAAVIAVSGGERGRRAAARAATCYAAAAVVANLLVKPLVQRRRPRGARKGGIGPVTSSFPSGHAATHLAFIAGSAQELPVTFIPLGVSALLAHVSIVRSRGHHPTDVVLGGFLGLAVWLLVRRLWSPRPSPGDEPAPGDGTAVAAEPRPPGGHDAAQGRLMTPQPSRPPASPVSLVVWSTVGTYRGGTLA